MRLGELNNSVRHPGSRSAISTTLSSFREEDGLNSRRHEDDKAEYEFSMSLETLVLIL